ncbi:hypothetical protein CFT13S00388_07920 [Campylobacter fetus subsp. testudinum]|uniref:hypothetical protein n=1 Tax=Campylobacter fetus TaxID=196 RepID=UPI000818A0C6|nr:hypothetical protein [Campylobacter fetus]OCR86676.1 hypothetical protein CFT13S00388_07920 [Campylobacter fetus subsp. testudinum]
MPYFNPRPITFNPDSGVIGYAGAMGNKLYDVYQDSLKNAQTQIGLDETKRNNAFNNNLASDKFNADRQDRSEDAAWRQSEANRAQQNTDRTYAFDWEKHLYGKEKDKKDLDYRYNALGETKRNNAFNNGIASERLQFDKDKEQSKQLQDASTLTASPSYFEQQGETKTISDNLKTIKDMGIPNYNKAYGIVDGSWEKIGGWWGNNANTVSDNMLDMMKDKIYRNNVRRDTAYNRETHDKLYPSQTGWKSESANQANATRTVRAYYNSEESEINDFYNKKLTQASSLKNPAITEHLRQARAQDLAKLNQEKQEVLSFYNGEAKESDNVEWTDINKAPQPTQKTFIDPSQYGITFR